MRIESDRPLRNGGWLHVDGSRNRTGRRTPAPRCCGGYIEHLDSPTLSAILDKWYSFGSELPVWAARLGVSTRSLKWLAAQSIGVSQIAFPMFDENGELIGIRLRNEAGKKWAVKGSRQGLFIPFAAIPTLLRRRNALVVEGPTDTAAGLDLGFMTIGRPACRGQEKMLADCLTNLGINEVIIVADNDEPGRSGASSLQGKIRGRSVIWYPPEKDLRAAFHKGLKAADISRRVKNLVWKKS
jgi:hypothetical protein